MPSPTKTLPEGYHLERSINLAQNRSLVVGLNVLALVFFILFGYGYLRLLGWMRPSVSPEFSSSSWLVNLLVLLIVYTGVILLHELIHGLFFWIITGDRPQFGVRGAYAFAAAPEWFLPREHYFVVGLAPLVLITLVGILLIPITPNEWLLPLGVAITANASGAIGDLAIVAWLLFKNPTRLLIRDHGDAVDVYIPETI